MKVDPTAITVIARAAEESYADYVTWLNEEMRTDGSGVIVEQPRDAFLIGFTWGARYMAEKFANGTARVQYVDSGEPEVTH